MNKQQACDLIGQTITFKRDNVMFSDNRNTFYTWKKGEECRVLGYVETPDPTVLLGIGSDFFDFQEVPLRHADRDLETSPATRLATAERRHALAS